ncbi:DoxX family protein [Mariniluteicoccus flavus]
MAGLIRVLRDIALLIVRVGFGALLIVRGWRRWTGDGGMQRQIDYLAQFQTPSPAVLAWGGTLLEIIGGLFLIFGLLTPLVALAVVVQQVMIILWTRYFKGPFLDNGGFEYQAVQAGLALLLAVFGGGRAAMDHLFKRSKDDDEDDDHRYVDAAKPRPTGSTRAGVNDFDPA